MVHTTCAVRHCMSSSRIDKKLKFHQFPHTEERCKLWVEACARLDLVESTCHNLKNTYVCSMHFEANMYGKNSLKKTAVPTLLLPKKESIHTQTDHQVTDFAGPSSQISENIDTENNEVSECKQNWSLLRNAYTHALGRRAKADNNENFVKWAYDEEMNFILPFIKSRKSPLDNQDTSNEEIHCELITNQGSEYTAKTLPLKVLDTPNLKQYLKINTNYDETRKRNSQEHSGETQHLNFAANMAKRTKSGEQEKDDIDLFFESVAATVKKLPKLERIQLKWDIMKMVNVVETRCVETNTGIDSCLSSANSEPIASKSSTDAGRVISTANPRPVVATSSPPLLISEQSFVKCKDEPSDEAFQLSQERVGEVTETDALVEANMLTVMSNSQSILKSILVNKAESSKPQALPYIKSVQSLATIKEEPIKAIIKDEPQALPYIESVESLATCEKEEIKEKRGKKKEIKDDSYSYFSQ